MGLDGSELVQMWRYHGHASREMERSIELLNKVLQLDINHATAWDLLQMAETEELSRGGELCI